MLIGVVVMMVLVICTRMHAFPSLIISAILIAVLSGNYLLVGTGNEGGNLLSVAISTVTGGFGGTMTKHWYRHRLRLHHGYLFGKKRRCQAYGYHHSEACRR